MRSIISILIFLFFVLTILRETQSQNGGELWIYNVSSSEVIVRVYPVSAVFNNNHSGNNSYANFNLVRSLINPDDSPQRDYINGVSINNSNHLDKYFSIPSGISEYITFDFDQAGGFVNGTKGTLGFGIYKVEFFQSCPYPEDPNCEPDEYFTIQWDFGYRNHNVCGAQAADLYVQFEDQSEGHPRVQYLWKSCECAHGTTYQDIPQDRKLYDRKRGCEDQTWDPDYGDFKYNTGTGDAPNPYDIIPIDPRIYCTASYFPGQEGGVPENHYFPGNDIGLITLNLTIEKDVYTPTVAPFISNAPPPIVIQGDQTEQAGPTLTIGWYPNWHTLTFQPYAAPYSNLGTDLIITPYGRLIVNGAGTLGTGSTLNFQNNCNAEIQPNGRMQIMPYAHVNMYGNSQMTWDQHSFVTFSTGSHLDINDNAVVLNCGAYTNVTGHYDVHGNGHYLIGINCAHEYETYSSQVGSVDSSGDITLTDNAVMEVGQDCSLIFDGPNSFLEADSGTTIHCYSNASIQFINGAYIKANGCIFTGSGWNGLSFSNISDSISIKNCTFTGASTYIDISNDKYHDTSQIIISGNTFNNGKVTIDNAANLYVLNNTFNCYNLTGDLLEVTNNLGELPENYHLDINYNTFQGGTGAQIRLDCYAGIITPFYITYNNFYGPNSGGATGLLAYNIAGDFKNNNFQNYSYSLAIELISCNINFYNNTLRSATGNTLTMVENSTAQLAPVLNGDGTFTWYGGYNKVHLDNKNTQKPYTCAYFESGSNLYTDQGKNCFYIYDISNNSHISGDLPNLCSMNPYYFATNNYWNTTPPRFQIYCGGNQAGVNYTPSSETCPSTGDITPISYAITDMGGGIYDTISVTPGPGNGGLGGGESSLAEAPPVNNDRTLYALILHQKMQKDFASAINNSIQLINSYDTSKYLASALDELYMCYQASDTSNDQNTTTALFGVLKAYLIQKMSDYQDLANFVEKAYNYYLMCLVKQRAFTEAIAGYENIMNYNPDPLRRLTASWDRAAVVLLMNGGGGAPNIVAILENTEAKFLNKDPHKLVKDVFLKKQKEESDNEGKVRKNEKYTKDDKAELQSRTVKFNPSTKKEFKEKIASDMMLVLGIQSKTSIKTGENNLNVPKVFKLYQNYPNPFNPETMIKYDLPKDGLVSIKIYDLLGKVVYSKTEYKLAGSYEFSFNGSSHASGLYFYRIEAGTFADSKKMVLIK